MRSAFGFLLKPPNKGVPLVKFGAFGCRYTIVMTGPGTAMLEFIDGARTLREVRTGTGLAAELATMKLMSFGNKGKTC